MNALTDEQLDRIDLYMASELNAEERTEVAELIANEPAWKEAFALRIAAREAGRKAFHTSMHRKFREIDRAGGRRRLISPIWLAAAAGVALLVSAVLWLFPNQQSDTLLAEYRSFPNVVLPIEKSGGEFSTREKAYQSYELREYAQAITLFSQLDSVQTVDRLYLGLSYLESGKYIEANTLLDEVRASSNPRWSEVADWYQVWLLLKQQKTEDAHIALERIAKLSGHRYHTDAQALHAKLGSR